QSFLCFRTFVDCAKGLTDSPANMQTWFRTLVIIACLRSIVSTVSGQIMPVGIGPDLTKFLGETNAFAATTEFSAGPSRLMLRFFYLDGMTRAEMDMTQLKGGPELDEEFKAMMRQAGTAEVITIFDPRKAVRLTIYPRLKSYVQMPLPKEQ